MIARALFQPCVLAAALLVAACGSSPRASASATPSGSSAGTGGSTASIAPNGSTASVAPTGSTEAPLERVELEPFVRGLADPVYLTHAGDGTGTLYVIEQVGRIRSASAAGELAERPFLDISERISAGGERGLLGLAFHPEYEVNERFYVNYTDRNGDTVIAEFRSRDGRGDPASERVLLTIDQPFANHNGGQLAFGPDGFLYIGTGDGGSGGDPLGNGQSTETLLGKILRIDVGGTGRLPYRVPRDNPFASTDGVRPEIWALGMRNPWRFSFDRETGDLWIGDVGQGAWEEIDFEAADDPGGRNYGWRTMEGAHCFGGDECARDGLTSPIAEYSHEEGCSVTGGYVYRGAAFPALVGRYVFADYCSGTIWTVDSDAAAAAGGTVEPREVGAVEGRVSSFGEDEAGELYLVTHGGTIFRVTAGGD